MDNTFIFAGFGGQGVILAGKLLAQAGTEYGLHVTWLPSYGPEMRGGTANCTIVLSDEPIGSPVVDTPTGLIAMNLPSLDRFEKAVAGSGTIVVNSSLVARQVEREDVRALALPLNDIAASLGNPRAANMVALGALVKATGAVPLETVQRAVTTMLGHKASSELIEVNKRALAAGYEAV
ncbi:MAG: 2-oxoacid:acceptor oxidoreductase family protein [Dehalococcoidia bacterium]|nr:2-oxoacid:acceptor oxidoreductase family protein [Dehalococcoidia bacterium]